MQSCIKRALLPHPVLLLHYLIYIYIYVGQIAIYNELATLLKAQLLWKSLNKLHF